MTDREKVIGLLHEAAGYFRECRNNASFASKAGNHFWELQNAMNEASELLKEQETIEPIDLGLSADFIACGCPICERWLDHDYKYCPYCGKKVKWNDRTWEGYQRVGFVLEWRIFCM